MTYIELLTKAEHLKNSLKEDLNTQGRFDHYMQMVHILIKAREEETVSVLGKKHKISHFAFSLKQLIELVTIFEFALKQLKIIEPSDRPKFIEKLKKILEGPNYPSDENPNNSAARNYQYELLVAANFFNSGYTTIRYQENPDLLVKIMGRYYAIECKRSGMGKDEQIIKRIEEGIRQLKKSRPYYAGIIAVDITQKYEKGTNWLSGSDKENLSHFAENQIENDLRAFTSRSQKIKLAAKNEEIILLIGSVSAVYFIETGFSLGQISTNIYLFLDEYNKSQERIVSDDLKKLKKG